MIPVTGFVRSVTGVIRVPVERALDALDVHAERMCVYTAAFDGAEDGDSGERSDRVADMGVVVTVERAADVDDLPADATVDVEPTDLVAVARTPQGAGREEEKEEEEASSESLAGWAFCRVDSPVRIDGCVRPIRFDGAYVWGLFVEPAYRGNGVGTALVRALTRVAARDRYPAAFALVAASNERSRRVFEHAGYRVVDETTRLTVRGRRLHANRLLDERRYETPSSVDAT